MKARFYQELLRIAPDAKSARFLLAVSGGRDSVVLAHLFTSFNLNFDIAHCNFHLRGDESNREMEFVKKLTFLTTQKVFVKEFDTLAMQQKSGKSIEMVARELRYQWFEKIGENYEYIVTAHHANDNVETVLINMLRGTGLRGMCGIQQKNNKIIRPLLKFSGSEIERYAHEQQLDFCVDSSNLTDVFLRNKLRHNVIPELEKIDPNFIETFSKNNELFSQQIQFFDTQIQQHKNQLLKKSNEQFSILIDALKEVGNQHLILYEILNPFGFNADDVKNILKSLHATSGKQFLSDTHILIKDRNHLIIEKKDVTEEEDIIIHTMEELAQHGFSIEKISYNADFQPKKSHNMIYVDAEKITFPLTIRGWKKGDFFYPFGMQTKKKMSDFFTDIKINLLEKRKIRFLCAQDQIVWVIGYRADNRFKVGANTRWYFKIECESC